MEIRDPIHGSIYFSDPEVAILESVEYQRLRAIKQLGFAEFSFPGATHNRFLHSVGVSHVASQIFDQIFRAYPFTKPIVKNKYRQMVRLAALLHDIGHGPLSHTTEQVMPIVSELQIDLYKQQGFDQKRRANHEDYTIKFLLDSSIGQIISSQFNDIEPIHVVALIDRTIKLSDNIFIDGGIDFRPVLSQIVSSELDADRMDYLERDSYFCGINYGKIDRDWLIQNLTFHVEKGKAYYALNRRALYAFDDFLISRHHMHLMVYFHHKSIIFEEMLNRYLTSEDCNFKLPADINAYIGYNDYKLHEHLSTQKNIWARRIADRKPYRVLLELHNSPDAHRPKNLKVILEENGIDVIWASSKARLSKYHSNMDQQSSPSIFIVDQYDKWTEPTPLNQATDIFHKYEGTRIIDRLYVSPENYLAAKKIID